MPDHATRLDYSRGGGRQIPTSAKAHKQMYTPGKVLESHESMSSCGSDPSAALTAICPETLTSEPAGLLCGFALLVSLQLASRGMNEI
jgi:hypothetical protein